MPEHNGSVPFGHSAQRHAPGFFEVACLVLPTIAIGASFVPAMRAANADPLAAIRTE